MITRKAKVNAKIGVFAVSHNTYDAQFPGLYDNFAKYHAELIEKIKKCFRNQSILFLKHFLHFI